MPGYRFVVRQRTHLEFRHFLDAAKIGEECSRCFAVECRWKIIGGGWRGFFELRYTFDDTFRCRSTSWWEVVVHLTIDLVDDLTVISENRRSTLFDIFILLSGKVFEASNTLSKVLPSGDLFLFQNPGTRRRSIVIGRLDGCLLSHFILNPVNMFLAHFVNLIGTHFRGRVKFQT